MILGLGIDLVEVERVRRGYEKFGRRFLDRILRPEEARYCLSYRQPAPHVAARFAAKEAVSKAFGTGISAELGWQDMEVARKDSGEPCLILLGSGLELMKARKILQIHLSLTHTGTHAAAVAVLEG
jgi:holo-[acyl-carrier protein] synthase